MPDNEGVASSLVALAAAIIMTRAAYHRQTSATPSANASVLRFV
jgi:hypothetical protein